MTEPSTPTMPPLTVIGGPNPDGSRRGETPTDDLGVRARADFPPLTRHLRPGVPLAYLDSAATALKPWPVIRAVETYYNEYPANVHRGLHALSERASEEYEQAREKVARFLGATDPAEVVFTRGTTESINLVAQGWGRQELRPGDEVVLTLLEHHANIVPWQMVAKQTGAVLRWVEVTDDGRVELEAFERVLSPRTRLVAVTGMSNVLGTVPPLKEMIALARQAGALVLVDGAQSVPHELGAEAASDGVDFLAVSAHKLYGPTGVGALYARRDLLERMEPMLGGGGMILRVTREGSEWTEPPWKFEAGTPPIAEAIGFGAAVDYLSQFDREAVAAHERRLLLEAHEALGSVPGVTIHGPDPRCGHDKGAIVAFTTDTVHPHDIAQLLDREGVAVRAGHHCAMPLHERLGLPATARASFALYNTSDDVDALARAVAKAKHVFER
ncbi:MAG: SufS family cysteine desulfurase [Isosphaeraceae bacterium]